MIPANAQSILLDGIAGWRGATEFLTSDKQSALSVDSLPGTAEDAGRLEMGCPGALAVDPCEKYLYWTELRSNSVWRADLKELNTSERISALGGEARGVRSLSKPRGLAVLSDYSLAIADTGKGRVSVFSGAPTTLLVSIGGFAQPWGLASDQCGYLYVADRGSGRVEKILRDGQRRQTLLSDLIAPTELALSRGGLLAVLEETSVVIWTPGGISRIPAPQKFTSLTFDDRGGLYAGTDDGVIFKYLPEDHDGRIDYRFAGEGVTGRDAGIRQMLWTGTQNILLTAYRKCASKAELWKVRADGARARKGYLLTEPLDSGLEENGWDRIELTGQIPEGTSLEVTTETAERNFWADFGAPFEPGASLVLSGDQRDFLVQSAPGRFLRLRIGLVSNEKSSPSLESIRLRFPRESYLKYLPAIYQEDAESRSFLDRFLAIFQSSFDSFDRQIDDISSLFDPLTTPGKMFPWLAAWLALPLNPNWTDRQKRDALKNAWQAYQLRGTPRGLEEVVGQYTGVKASVVEHFRFRPMLLLSSSEGKRLGRTSRLWSRSFYARLQVGVFSQLGYFRLIGNPEPAMEPLTWGAHRFSVFFQSEPLKVEEDTKLVRQIVEREKPAHTEAVYCPVLPRMRVGVQSTVGVDTRIGTVTRMVVSKMSKLGYDSVLGCSRQENDMRRLGAPLQVQTGVNTRLQ